MFIAVPLLLPLQEGISRGTLSNSSNANHSDKAAEVDWGAPVAASSNKADAFDWGAPVSEQNNADAFDWGATVSNRVRFDDELELDLKLDSDSDEDEEKGESFC